MFNRTAQLPVSRLKLLGERLGWIAFFVTVFALLLQVTVAHPPDERSQHIVRKIESLGGNVGFYSLKPKGNSNWFETNLEGLIEEQPDYTVRSVFLRNTDIPPDVLTELKSLPHLEQLFVNNSSVTNEGFGNLATLKNLRWLSLCNTKVTESDLKQLKGLKQLEVLGLQETQITDAGLEHLTSLTNLKEIFLANNNVTDAGLKHLHTMTGLKRLGLYHTQTTSEGRALLRLALPNCVIEPPGLDAAPQPQNLILSGNNAVGERRW